MVVTEISTVEEQLIRVISTLIIAQTKLSIHHIMNGDDDDILEKLINGEVVQNVVKDSSEERDDSSTAGHNCVFKFHLSRKEQINDVHMCLRVVKC